MKNIRDSNRRMKRLIQQRNSVRMSSIGYDNFSFTKEQLAMLEERDQTIGDLQFGLDERTAQLEEVSEDVCVCGVCVLHSPLNTLHTCSCARGVALISTCSFTHALCHMVLHSCSCALACMLCATWSYTLAHVLLHACSVPHGLTLLLMCSCTHALTRMYLCTCSYTHVLVYMLLHVCTFNSIMIYFIWGLVYV